jgi:predicted oxidoreductase
VNLVRTQPRVLGSLPPVGPLSFGLWRYTNTDVAAAQSLLETALDAGMNLIDNADVYGFDWGGTGFGSVEEILGSVLAAAPGLRDRMVLATKGGIVPPTPYDSSPAYLRSACEASLRRMRVDVIDLYQIHRPDLLAHPADVASHAGSAARRGQDPRGRRLEPHPGQVAALAAHLPFPIASNQPEYSALHLDPMRDGTFDACMALRAWPLAWSPLGGGRLATGDGVRPELLEVLDGLAAREGVDRATIAIAFVLAHPAAPVAIIGSQNPERIAGSTAALDVELTRADVYSIIQASEGVPLP